ncbi:MAG: DUF7452 domain-containing protein [Myxococcales bacterium]
MRNNIKSWIRALAIAIVAVPILSQASNLTTPNSFSSGTLIQSAQVNANFAAVQSAVNSKQDAISGSCAAGQAMTGVGAGGVPTCAATGLAFGASVSGSASTSGVTVANAGAGAGLEGDNSSTDGYAYGVLGQITSTTPGGFSTGVKGENSSTTGLGVGVWGETQGSGWGVYGDALGAGGWGVYGTGPAGGAGVVAANDSATGVALSVGSGYLQVRGAGMNTSTTAFQVVSDGSSYILTINNPMTNGNPNLLLFATAIYGTGSNAVYNNHPTGVWYNGSNWTIFNEDRVTMAAGAEFNVLVVSP